MYSLNLMDGTTISNLNKIGENTFTVESPDSQLYFLLTDSNLSLAFLEEEDLPAEIYTDFALVNFSFQDGIIQFKIGPWDEVHKETNREKKYRKDEEWRKRRGRK